MYIVELVNNNTITEIHGIVQKLTSGKIVKGINAIDSFTFTMLPNNAGFNLVNEFTSHVRVYDQRKQAYTFRGRVLYAETSMSADGKISKSVTCESVAGYFCDSYQDYVEEQNWTVVGLLQHLIDCHNSQVEEYKQFQLGTVEVTDPNDNVYIGIQYENTWDSIQTKLLDKLGGELQFRYEGPTNYIDYLLMIGEEKATPIALSRNMKSITKEQDPTSYVTRLIPLGKKLTKQVPDTDENGNPKTDKNGNIQYKEVQSEQRVTIAREDNGYVKWIDDAEAIALYGVHVGVVTWDDVEDPVSLEALGHKWMATNNRVRVKYSITALDLSLLGLDIDDFDIGNIHPIQNALIGVDDKARIIKKNIDVCEVVKSTIEVGDNLKTLSDIQYEQAKQIQQTSKSLSKTATSLYNDLQKAANSTLGEPTLSISGSLGGTVIVTLKVGDDEQSCELDLSKVLKGSGAVTFDDETLYLKGADGKRYLVIPNADGTVTCTEAELIGG